MPLPQHNQYVAKLNAKNGGKKIGPSLVLKVMAGDTIQIGARAFYKSTGQKDNKSASPEDMVASLLQAFGGGTGEATTHGAGQVDRVSPFGNFNGSDYQRLKERDADQNQQDKPKAYLNFVLFDDQFNLVEENSGVRQVKGEPDELQTLAVDKMPITKSGFLYVYTSNETEQDVLFDNVTVLAASGPLLEETHYYPFGLTMAGISSNALKGMNYPQNRKKYNGIEFTEDLDLDIYDAQLRNLDPQIGRWSQVDPKIENMEMWSPYASNYDNPIKFNDFLGDEPDDGGPGILDRIADGLSTLGQRTVAVALGAGNAFATNHVLGVGRKDVESSGFVGDNALAYQVGQKIGDAASVVAGAVETIVGTGGEVITGGLATPVAIPLVITGLSTTFMGLKNSFMNPIRNTNSPPGTRRKNWLPDKGQPNSTQTNSAGTTTKKYGPDGNIQKEFNRGHPGGNKVPKNERSDHVHDYKPNPHNPSGRGDRQPGRRPKKNELKKDFGISN
jgi:RHS repeat-associated protein